MTTPASSPTHAPPAAAPTPALPSDITDVFVEAGFDGVSDPGKKLNETFAYIILCAKDQTEPTVVQAYEKFSEFVNDWPNKFKAAKGDRMMVQQIHSDFKQVWEELVHAVVVFLINEYDESRVLTAKVVAWQTLLVQVKQELENEKDQKKAVERALKRLNEEEHHEGEHGKHDDHHASPTMDGWSKATVVVIMLSTFLLTLLFAWLFFVRPRSNAIESLQQKLEAEKGTSEGYRQSAEMERLARLKFVERVAEGTKIGWSKGSDPTATLLAEEIIDQSEACSQYTWLKRNKVKGIVLTYVDGSDFNARARLSCPKSEGENTVTPYFARWTRTRFPDEDLLEFRCRK